MIKKDDADLPLVDGIVHVCVIRLNYPFFKIFNCLNLLFYLKQIEHKNIPMSDSNLSELFYVTLNKLACNQAGGSNSQARSNWGKY